MRKIITRSKICVECGEKYQKPYGQGIKPWNKRKFCSHPCYSLNLKGQKRKPCKKSTKIKIGNANRGSKNGQWRGGITPLLEKIRQCFKNTKWKRSIYKRDNFICQMPNCDNTEKCIQAHHIKKLSIILKENNIKTLEEALNCKELWKIENGITLCKRCHEKIRQHEQEYAPLFLDIIKSKASV